MLKKFLLLILTSALAFGVSPVFAATLVIGENGQIYWEQDEFVLGQSTESSSNQFFDKSVKTVELSEDKKLKIGVTNQISPSGGEGQISELDELEQEDLEVEEETEDEQEISELEAANEFSGEDEVTQTVDKVKIKHNRGEMSISPSQNGVFIRQNKVRVQTKFPISVGPNNDLVVETPQGTKSVNVLPQEAVSQMTKFGLNNPFMATGPADSNTTDEQSEVETELEVSDKGDLTYTLKTQKEKKLFGLFGVKTNVTARVSAENGEVTTLDQPWYFNYFDFLFR